MSLSLYKKIILTFLFCIVLVSCEQGASQFDFSNEANSSENLSEESLSSSSNINFLESNLTLTLDETIDVRDILEWNNSEISFSDLLWYINNSQIVDFVSEHEIQAKSLGTTTLKATLGNTSGVLNISVIAKESVFQNVRFSESYGLFTNEDTLHVLFDFENEDTFYQSLTAYELGQHLNCDVRFENQNPEIFRVHSSGFITPLQNGAANIFVFCNDESLELPLVSEAFTTESQNDTGETLLEISFDLNDEYEMGTTELLRATLVFDSGTVENVVQTYTTPLGRTGQISWQSSNTNILRTRNGTAYFYSYGDAQIHAEAESQNYSQTVSVKMAPENSATYQDQFLGYDDFPGYQNWPAYSCPFVQFGDNAGYAQHLCPAIVMNVPYGNLHTLSLGRGGVATFELNGFYPIDGPGPDFTIFENPILNSEYGYFPERAKVSVSQDGVTFYDFECDAFDENLVFAGCAGVGLVYEWEDPLNPSVSGGDQFDLADLGLNYIRYIRITDLSTCQEGDITYETQSGQNLCNENGKEGFDLDSIAILNGRNE